MLNFDDRPRQVHASVGFFLDTQSAIGIIKKCHLGYFIVDDSDILCWLFADDIMGGGLALNYGIIPHFTQRNFDTAIPIGHKGTDGVTIRADDLEQCPTNWNLGAGLIFEDSQAGFILDGRTVRIVAVCGQSHCGRGVSIYYIILEFAVFIFLLAYRKKYGVFINIRAERQLNAAGFSLHAFQRIQYLELASIAVACTLGGDRGNVLIVHVHNACALRDERWIRKRHIYRIITYPSFRPESKNLLLVLLSVNGDLIGGIPIWSAAYLRGEHFIPGRTTGINVLCRSQNLLRSLEFYAG